MAYNDEALRTKLSTLNETQDSIVSVSQWITFHRRYADRIAQVWLTRLRDSPPAKRLNYVYLVNDIVQNAKARKRAEFSTAFAPIIAEAVQQAYRSSTRDIQGKIQRVIDVWKQRTVFEDSILQAIQARVDDVDKSKASSGKKLMGNSLFSSSSGVSMPKELESLGPLQMAVTKADFTSKPLVETAQSEHTRLNDPTIPRPSAPVYAANLSSLIKKLNSAENAVNDSVTARRALLADLRRLTDAAETSLSKDENTLLDISAKRTEAETSKRDVEDSIMRGLSETPAHGDENGFMQDSRPDVEELTPEPDEFPSMPAAPLPETTLSPPPQTEQAPRNPGLQGILAGFGSSTPTPYDTASDFNPTAAAPAQPVDVPQSPPFKTNTPSYPLATTNGPPSNKKRKLSHTASATSHISEYTDNSVPDLGAMGVTGYDGTTDYGVGGNEGVGADDYNPSQPAAMYASMSNTTAGGYMGTIGQRHDHDQAGNGNGDLMGNLSQNIDELIRGQQG